MSAAIERRRAACTAYPAVLAASLAAASGCGDYTPLGGISDPSLTLVWSDEFSGDADAPPDPTHWSYDVGGGDHGWGNDEMEYYTDSPDNVSLDGAGHLRIVARKGGQEQKCWYGRCQFTSGRIKTKGDWSGVYGHIEARIRVPSGKGVWPAFWMLGDNIDEVPWPGCGEIDIMENSGSEPGIVHGTLHGPGYYGSGALSSPFGLVNRTHFADDFHVFAADWTENGIHFLVDGMAYGTQLPTSIPAGATWAYDHRFFLLLDFAVGGNFVNGAPDESTIFPQTMLIDYVRWYQKK